MPEQQSGGKYAITSLAGRLISCHADSHTKRLLQAFDPVAENIGGLIQLKVDFAFDETSLAKVLEVSPADSAHLRRGQEHAWITRHPRHAETLLLSSPSRSRLFADHESIHEASMTARPAIASVSAWATHNEMFPSHASAVSREDDGLLLVGEGGRGKTTTALALAMCGWNLIADDRCFVNAQDEALMIHGLYKTTIVTPDVAGRFPELLGEHIGVTSEGKIATHLPTQIAFGKSAKLRGLVLLTQQHDHPYRMTRLNPHEALAAWQQMFMFTDPSLSPERSLFSLLTKVSRTVPAWRLNLGWDFQMLDKTLRRHMEEICTTLITK
jgi:hypothetical protein